VESAEVFSGSSMRMSRGRESGVGVDCSTLLLLGTATPLFMLIALAGALYIVLRSKLQTDDHNSVDVLH
jgi:hypothetical protein